MINSVILLSTLAAKIAADKPWEPSTELIDGLNYLEGKVLKGNLHRVYDDKNNRYVWDGTIPYDTWKAGVKGNPTVGYGNRMEYLSEDTRNKILAAGGATNELASTARNDHLKHQERILRRYFPNHWNKLSRNQRNAVRSLYYNLGPFAKTESLKQAINSGNYTTVPGLLDKYVYADGVRNHGLMNRRAREADWFNGILKSSRTVPRPESALIPEKRTIIPNPSNTQAYRPPKGYVDPSILPGGANRRSSPTPSVKPAQTTGQQSIEERIRNSPVFTIGPGGEKIMVSPGIGQQPQGVPMSQRQRQIESIRERIRKAQVRQMTP